MISYIFKNKRKNILATVFSALVVISEIYEIIFYIKNNNTFSFINLFIKLLSMLPFVLVLIYLLTLEKEYRAKNFIFPAAFLCLIVSSIYTIISSFKGFIFSVETVKYVLSASVFDIILLVAFVLCMLGTLEKFRMSILFKIGTLVISLTYIALPIAAFTAVGGFDYIAAVPEGYTAVSITAILNVLLTMLYYFGLFNLTLNKKESTQELDKV